MPITPYHFGPAGLVGYIYRQWVDIPVFILANVAVDVEVEVIRLANLGWPYHRFCHTLIGGSIVGFIWGISAYFITELLLKKLTKIKTVYQPRFWKMAISGILGGAFHSFIDSFCHYDVQIFWPIMKKNPFWNIISQNHIKQICLACFVILAVLYIFSRMKTRRTV